MFAAIALIWKIPWVRRATVYAAAAALIMLMFRWYMNAALEAEYRRGGSDELGRNIKQQLPAWKKLEAVMDGKEKELDEKEKSLAQSKTELERYRKTYLVAVARSDQKLEDINATLKTLPEKAASLPSGTLPNQIRSQLKELGANNP